MSSNQLVIKQPTTKPLFMLWAGHLMFALGFIGMLLPLMPTTVFWIVATVCYAKSSPRLYQKLISHPRLGQPIQLYLECGAISRKGKCFATVGMAVSAAILILSPLNEMVAMAGLIGLGIAGLYVNTRPGELACS